MSTHATTGSPATRPPVSPAAVLLALGSALLSGGGHRAVAQQTPAPPGPMPIPVEEAVDFRSFPNSTPIALSPDGGRVAYVVEGPERTIGSTEALLDPDGGAWTEVRVARVATGEVETVAPAGASSWSPSWSPDGERLAFLANGIGGDVHVWVWEPASGELRRVSDAPVWVAFLRQVPRWTPDGRRVVIKVVPPGRTTAEMRRRAGFAPADTASEPRDGGDVTVRLLRANVTTTGEGDADGDGAPEWIAWRYGGDLATIDVASGEVARLTSGAVALWWDVSPDGTRVAFTDFEAVAGGEAELRIGVVPIDGGESWHAPGALRQAFGEGVSWSPDGSRLAYLSGGEGEDAGLFLVDAERRTRRRLGPGRPDWSHRFGPVWSYDGRRLYFSGDGALWRVEADDGITRRVRLDRTDLEVRQVIAAGGPHAGSARWILVRVGQPASAETGLARLDPAEGTVVDASLEPGSFGGRFHTGVTSDGRTVVTRFGETRHPYELWRLDSTLDRDRRLSHLNPAFRPERLADDRLLRWTAPDGTPRQALLVLPPGVETGEMPERPLPTVVEIYGDRSAENHLDTFDRERQLLATRGYAVLMPEIPLETGRTLRGHAEAVLPALDHAVELGITDPRRVGVWGHSYGGYGTLALLVQTDRFAAAVASAAQGNLFGLFGRVAPDGTARTRYLESGQGAMGATPWEDLERYIENSPVFHLDRVHTPLLLLHGSEDANTPVHLAEEIFAGLRRLGRPVALAAYEGEGHWWGSWRMANQVDYWERLIGWLEGHLRPGAGR